MIGNDARDTPTTRTTDAGSSTVATHGRDDAVEGSWSPKRPRTAAGQRAVAPPVATDAAVLAADIQRTREDLAQTLDAIADRVSPKRVAKRVGDSAKESAGKAEEALKLGAAAAVETVKDVVETVKEKVSPSPDGATAKRLDHGPQVVVSSTRLEDEPLVAVSSVAAPVVMAPNPLSQDTVSVPISSAGALADATPAPDVAPGGAELPAYSPYTPPPASPIPVYAGAAAALAVVLLVLRRRRR